MRFYALFISVLFFTASQAQLSGTYFIDDGGGGDYLSLTAAVSDLNTQGVSAPVTFNFAPGSGPYYEQVSITQGGSPGNRVTFNGNDVEIQYGPSDWNLLHIIKVDEADFITFNDLNLRKISTGFFPSPRGWGLHLYGSTDHIVIDGCSITFPEEANSGHAGIVGNQETDNFNAYLNPAGPSFLQILNCEITNASHSIVINGRYGFTSNIDAEITVEDNKLINVGEDGIYLSNFDNFIIKGNEIRMYQHIPTGFAIPGTSISIVLCNGNNLIEGNSIIDPIKLGIGMNIINVYSPGEMIVRNNFIGGSHQVTGVNSYSFSVNSTHGLEVLNNTFYGHGNVAKTIHISSNNSAVEVLNNIFVHSSGFPVSFEDPAVFLALDHNVYWGASGIGRFGFPTAYSFSEFLSLPGGPAGRDDNSLNVLPLFSSIDDYSLSDPLLESKGFPGIVLKDIDGEIRNSAPDIGADEFDAVCATPENLLAANLTSTGVTLSWDEVRGAQSYLVQGRQVPSGPVGQISPTASMVEIDILTPGEAYQWRCKAVCDFAIGDFSSPGNFSTPVLRPNETIGNDSGISNLEHQISGDKLLLSYLLDENVEDLRLEILTLEGRTLKSYALSGAEGQNTVEVDLSFTSTIGYIIASISSKNYRESLLVPTGK